MTGRTVGPGSGAPRSPRSAAGARNAATAAVLLATLPTLLSYFWICLEYFDGKFVFPKAGFWKHVPMPTWSSAGIAVGWLVFQGLLQIYAPGKRVEGAPLPDGRRLEYRMNGWFSWWFTWACIGAGVARCWISPTLLADQFGPLMMSMNILAFAFCLSLFARDRKRGAVDTRAARNPISDFWLGAERDPRIGSFDLKFFCEARPGLIGWVAIDLSLAARQHQLHGSLTAPMVLICLFHFWYVADYFLHEEAILTTWDIRHENFGFMLCWGALMWVPFTYTIPAYYLVTHTHGLSGWATAGLVILNFTGYAIFRGANIQKHRFRRHPERPIWGKPAEFLETARGSLLLTSGWWGLSRHMNYLGDLLMTLAWCLLTGFGSPLPYVPFFFLLLLLVHRERRDFRMCSGRYGQDWEAYCRKVRWRILPGIY